MSQKAGGQLPEGIQRFVPAIKVEPFEGGCEFASIEPHDDGDLIRVADLPSLIEHFKERLLSDEAKAAAATTWDRAHAEKMARFMQSVRPSEVAQPIENSDVAGVALLAALIKAFLDNNNKEAEDGE